MVRLKWVVFGFGLLLFFVGIFGIYGVCKDNSFFLTIYAIVIGIFSLAFLLIGVVGLILIYSSSTLSDIKINPLANTKTTNITKNVFYN